ncbi:hemagglutinin repeat-containing protein [Pseudomonas gingeri]|uniref:two-partner secretion domain-containing protein n=1 Tax=Pseudomonas gingeri TaxID=117681 RepID=UPI0015A3640B|nr:hemagglutinin repeat-containing protein [Pseudomonas gingeri]NWD75824.1 hemagglutinin repeat-containing protein [Pseudomonas gingeri]
MDVRQFAFLAGQPSAVLKNREHFLGLSKRGLAFILANAMFWQPLLAQADGIAVSGGGTTLGQAGNGVPIVNIAAPNAQGLSHNQFSDYNVGANGVILNNATARTQSTQLGGIILGNQNLNGTAANIILNEVNGASPSQLRGYTEVAGQSAHVIVANPYGISCNGCGFINTPQATLTTGKPVITNGQVTGYQVDRGSVSIDGAGLNASNIDQFEIITRSAKLNAEINAKKLAIIAGANDVDAKTLKATARAANPADAPQLAIDSSALGGMYAGAIRLVGTEAGVGVKLDGKMVASGGDIQLDANGHLSMVETGASGSIDVKAASLEAKGPMYAGTTLDVKTQGDLTSQNNLVAKDRITLSSGGQLTNNGIIEAGVNADKTRNALADVSITAQNVTNNGQSVVASRDLSVTATQTLNNQGGTLSGQRQTSVTAGTLDNQNKGRVLGADHLNLTADTVLNAQGGLIKGQNSLAATLGYLNNNAGEVSSQGNTTLALGTMDNLTGLVMANNVLDITATGLVNNQNGRLGSNNSFTFKGQSLDNTQKGRITAQQKLDLTATHLDNTGGSVITNGPLSLTADIVDNATGRISSQGDLTANVTTFNQQDGALVSDGNLSLTGSSLDNRNAALISAKKLLTLNVGAIDNRSGEISSVQAVNLNGQFLNNSEGGKVLSDTALGLKVAQVINQSFGQLVSQGSTTLTGSSLDNSGGKLSAQTGLVISLDGALTNQLSGLINSEGVLTAHAASVDNTGGSFSSAGQLSLTSDGALINQGGKVLTDSGIVLNSASLDNRQQGAISGQGPVSISTGNFDNSHGGFLSSGDRLELTSAQLTNQDGGRIGAKTLVASVTGLDQQGGSLKGDTSLTLDLNHGQLNNQGGLINAPLLVLNNLKGVNNQGGEISSAQAFTLAAESLSNDNGKLLSNQALTLRIDQALSNIKGMIAAAAVDAHVGSLDNSGGSLTSLADLGLSVEGQLTNQNQGKISASNGLTLNAAGIDNQGGSLLGSAIALDFGAATGDLNNAGGQITTAGNLTLNHLRDLNNQGGVLSSAQSLNLSGRTLDNSNGGKLISNNQLTLNAATVINQNGGLLSGWQGLAINAGSLDNRNNGTVSSRSGDVDVTLSGALLNSNAGALASQQVLTISAGSLDNSAGSLSSAGAQKLTVAGLLNNGQGGLIDAGTTLTLNAMTLNNSGTVQAQQALSFTGTNLDNSNGSLSSKTSVNLDLLGALTNTHGQISAVGPLLVQRATQINNQGGQFSSQGLLTLLTGGLDNSNGGTIGAGDKLLVTASGTVLNSNGGLIASRNADLQLSAASLGNGKGLLQGQGAVSLDVSGDIDNQSGKVIAQDGTLLVKAANLDNRGGVLSSVRNSLETRVVGVLRNSYDLNNNRQAGSIQGQSLNLNALGGFDNYGGRIAARAGDLVLATGNLDNRNGGLYASGQVKVSGNDFDNSGDMGGQIAGSQISLSFTGALNNRKGIIESDNSLSITAASLDNQTGQLHALGTSGKTLFQIGGFFDNRSGNLEIANSDLTLGAGSFMNQGGSVLHVGNGTFDIATANVLYAGGNLVTRGGLTLTADSWTNSGVIQAGRLTLNIGTLNQLAGAQLLASTSLTGTGGNWNNDGLIASDGSVNLGLGGSYTGNGRLSSLGTLGLSAAQLSLGNTGSIAGGGNTTLNVGGVLSNYGRLTSAASMSLTAGGINNYGTLGSAQILTASTGALLNDHGLVFSGGDMSLRLDSLTNSYGNIYSLGNLAIDRDGQGGLASSIVNSSGSIQSDGGMSLSASTIRNVRAVLTTNNQGIYTASIGEVQCIEGYNAGDCSGKQNHVWQIIQRDKFEVTEASAASSITAGANLNVQGGDLLNQSSTIAAGGSFSARVNNLTNSGLETGETETSRTFMSERTKDAGGWYAAAAAFNNSYSIGAAGYNPNNLGGLQGAMSSFIGMTETELGQFRTTRKIASSDQSYAAVIQAGGAVNVQAQNGIDNSVVRPGYTYVGAGARTDTQSSGSNFSTRITVNAQLPPNLAQQQVNPLTLPGFSLPTGQNGLFRLSGEGSSSNVITPQSWTLGGTSLGAAQRQSAGDLSTPSGQAALAAGSTQGSQATSLARVQGLPDTSGKSNPQKYLIETNPVLTDLKQFMSSDYLLANLGYDPDASAKRLGDGFYEQKLIQQAVVSRTGQRFIDGQTSDDSMFKYLMNNAIASKQELNLQLGVSLTSEQVAALTHDIVWMENATVNGEQVLVPVLYLANANNRLAANGALIQGSDVTLIAGKDLNNAGTLRASNNLSAAAGNDLVNSGLLEASQRLDALANNNLTNRAGGIIAGRDVSLAAINGDVTNERTITTHQSSTGYKTEQRGFADNAASIEASNNLTVSAGRDINNSGGVLRSATDTALRAGRDVNITSAQQLNSNTMGDRHSDATITQNGSTVSTGRDLLVSAGRDLSVVASQIDAKRDIAFSAVDDLTLSSAANEQHSYGRTKKVTSQEDHTQQVSSSVTAGGNVLLTAGKDLGLVASKVNAGAEAYLNAGANLTLQTATNDDYSFYSKTKKSSSGKKSRLDEMESTTNIASAVTSGSHTSLVAGNDIVVKGSAVVTEKGGTQLSAGNDVQILAVTDSASARHESSKSKSSWGGLKSSKAQDKVAETQTTAVGSLIAGDTLDVVAKRDATVTGSALASTGDLTVQAGRDLTINAAQNTFTRDEMHKEKGHDFTGILTANKLGIDDITGNQHLNMSSSSHNGQATQTTLTGSTIGSSQGNVNLVAGRNLGVVASDLVSTRNMNLTGSNVTIAAGMESASQSSTDKSASLGVGRVLGGSVISTLETIYNLRESVEATKAIDDPRLRAVKQAQLAMSVGGIDPVGMAKDVGGAASNYLKGQGSSGSLIKIGTELASTRSKSSSHEESQTAKQSTINSGAGLTIIATGATAGTAGDIHVIGSQLKGANTVLDAKNNILLESAQNTTDKSSNSSNSKTAIGASFNLGEQNGFTLDLGAQIGKQMGDGHSVTQVNSTLDTGSLVLHSGKDTTLAGAQVKADSINAVIGGNLDIVSRQDTESQKSKQGSAGFGASICIPPFCYGSTVSASANLSVGNMNSDYKAVTDQSGLFAGTGGYNITVGQTTNLQGAVIASDASADKNRLSTDRLVVSDIKNKSEASSQSAGISLSYGKDGLGFGGSMPLALSESGESKTRSAVSEGTIIVRNAEGANDLVGLNRDTANANPKLDKPDVGALQTRIDLIQSSIALTQSVVGLVASAEKKDAEARVKKAKDSGTDQDLKDALLNLKTVSDSWDAGGDKKVLVDIASGLIGAAMGGAGAATTLGIVANTTAADTYKRIGDYADQQLAGAKDPATQAAWKEGGSARVLMHTLAAAVQGLSGNTVGANALGAGVAGLTAPLVAEKVAQMDLPLDVKKSLILGASGLAAAGVGGITGAQSGMEEVKNNYLKHEDVELLSKQLAVCAADNTACRMRVQLEAKRLSDANDAELLKCTDQVCLDKHIAQIVDGAKSFGDLYAADKAVNSKDKDTFGAISDIETNSLLVAANMAAGLPGFKVWASNNCESVGMAACQLKFADVVKSGTFINSKGEVGGAIPKAFDAWENIAGSTKQPHEYNDVSSGCMVTLGGCGTLENEYEALKRNAGPGGDGTTVVKSGDVSELYLMKLKLGYVAHLTDDSSKSVINITLPGMHALDPGFVVRSVVPTASGGFDIETHGWGTGSSPLFNANDWGAGGVWGGNSAWIAGQELFRNSPVFNWDSNSKQGGTN